jgi:eukaryotic-like serine/threonine-protein kinase
LEETAQWQRIKELFESALERDPGEREAFLSHACGSDSALHAEIQSLLIAHAHASALSYGPVAIQVPPELHEGDPIGPYRLIRRIGEGGMGQVWLADQTEPLQRQVALKLIRTGFFDDSLLQRFQSERQSLAVMEHPAIAKVFDAGMTPAGQPFLVMEYVAGEPVTRYCDRKQLTVRDRLDLFARVCDGVQHAHQKAVIHRDLKPANILVIEVDGQPAPRIIDFGLASIVEPGSVSENSSPNPVAGTPGYMSPEQLAGADLDTRTDVYSLGVVLYELMTGLPPFDAKGWHQEPLSRFTSRLKEMPLILPSRRLSSANAGEVARLRRCTPRQLARQLAGDIDLIAAKALEKDRARRYGTPLELAADIRRFLTSHPIEAHPPGTRYFLQKYVRRHRVGAAMAVALALVLAGAAVLQTLALRRIARERDRATRISDFMVSSFRIADPSEARGNQITAREILDHAYSQIDPGLHTDPDMQSQMMMVMGAVYENLGLYSRAVELYRKASAIREQQFGPENTQTLQSQASLAWALYRDGKYHDSEQLLRTVLAVRLRRSGENNADTITVMDYLGAVLNDEGHSSEAETLERKTLAWRTRVDGPSSPDTLVSMNHLALALQNLHRLPEAENLDRAQIAGWQRVEGVDSMRGLFAADNLAIILYLEGRLGEAESLDRQTLAAKRRVLGPDHPETVRSMNTLTAVLTDEGKLQEAKTLGQDVLAIRTRILGPEHPLTLSAMSNLGEILTRLGDYNQAQNLLEKARVTAIRVLGANSPQSNLARYNLACLALRRGQSDEAIRLLRDAFNHNLPRWIIAGMSKDPDLKALHGDPRFEALLASANGPGTAASNR